MPPKNICVLDLLHRNSFSPWKAAAAALVFAAAGQLAPLRAALGGDFTSVQSDQAKMQGSLRSTAGAAFTVHEIQAASGVAVKEYVSPAGRVFAVTWSGPFHPDLRQLLGSYFDQYTQAVDAQRATRHGHGPLSIEQQGLVIQVSGHARAFRGKVYLPQMLPAGARVEDIQ